MPASRSAAPGLAALAGVAAWSAVLISLWQVRDWESREAETGRRKARARIGPAHHPGSPPQMLSHLRSYTQPTYQRYIVRIVFMVPFYAVASFFSLIFERTALYFDTVRDW